MTILCDIDNTINNFSQILLTYLNLNEQTDYKVDDITTYDWFEQNFKDPWKYTNYPSFWKAVSINPNAVKTLELLAQNGHQIYLVSSSHFNDMLGLKIRNTLANFNPSLINESNIIITQNKWAIKGDVLIDDCIDNLDDFEGIRICYKKPWNANYTGALKAKTWEQVYGILLVIEDIRKV